jgi:hypothetical protein
MKKIAALITIMGLLVTGMARAESTTLASQTGSDIGLSLSSYQYREPDFMSLVGAKLGLDLRATKAFQNQLFVRGDLRYAFGYADYSGSGSLSGLPDWYVEARGLVGEDWTLGDAVVSPYIGLGYRHLSHDGRGISCIGSTCYFGYRRESNYLYLPIGVTHRIALNDRARLVTELEYDHLLSGKQVSMLSDGGVGYSDVTNSQNSGYGLKLSVMYEKNKWAVGPYLHYWNIDQSDWVPLYRYGTPVLDPNGNPLGGVEPKNNTVEFGVKARQQF